MARHAEHAELSPRPGCRASEGTALQFPENCRSAKYVVEDPRFFRPAEVDLLQADPSLARRELQWAPTVSFEGLVRMMVDADLKRLRGES